MNKFLLMFVSVFMMGVMPVEAQELTKEQMKSLKKTIKQIGKEGWKVFGTSYTLEYALKKHYERKSAEGAMEIIGDASAFSERHVSLGTKMALTNACVNYASLNETKIEGMAINEISNSTDLSKESFDKFFATYKTSCQATIRGDLNHSFSIIKDNGNGTMSMRSFFVVDKKAAMESRLRVLEQLALESDDAQRYANVIKKYIGE